MAKPRIEVVTYIAATPDKIWSALTDPEVTERYWGGTRIESDWKVGSKVIYRREGKVVDEHTLLECEPQRRLRHTFHPMFPEDFRAEAPSRVTIELATDGPVARLHMVHDEFEAKSKVYEACREAWPMLLSSLKTLLETGKPLPESRPA